MSEHDFLELIQIPEYYLSDRSIIGLRDGYAEINKERFIAIGLEKSRAAKNWEGTDYFM